VIVVDTNIIAYLYISGDFSSNAEKLLDIDSQWCAPRLWRSELRNVLALYLRRELLSIGDTIFILRQAEELLGQNEYEVSSTLIMNLVKDSSCSAYDCEFVALAKHLNTPLITSDKKILREFPDFTVSLAVHTT
jgi:predicted nucleic acid-binding protein